MPLAKDSLEPRGIDPFEQRFSCERSEVGKMTSDIEMILQIIRTRLKQENSFDVLLA